MEIGRILASSLTDGRALLPPDGLPLLIETLGASYKPGRGGGSTRCDWNSCGTVAPPGSRGPHLAGGFGDWLRPRFP